MPNFNADQYDSNYEPLELTCNGKTYKIERITDVKYEAISNLAGIKKITETQATELLGKLFEVEPVEFNGMDFRKILQIVNWVIEILTKQMDGAEDAKNESGTEVEK